MALTIFTNVSSLNAQRNLSASQAGLTTTMQRLSSGLRVNTAPDGQVKFPHPWPPQIPPGGTAGL